MAVLGNLFTTAVAVLIVATGIDASLAGFALAFSLDYSSAIISTIHCYIRGGRGLSLHCQLD
jgi:hypothetical protein